MSCGCGGPPQTQRCARAYFEPFQRALVDGCSLLVADVAARVEGSEDPMAYLTSIQGLGGSECVCVCTGVCACVCMCVYRCVCMCPCVRVRMHVHACVRVFVYVCMRACVFP